MPPVMLDLCSVLVLELEPDEELGRTMKDRIGRNEKPFVDIDVDQQRREKAELVLPEHVGIIVGVLILASVLDLKAAFIFRPVSGWGSRRSESIGNHAHALTCASLERDDKRSAIRTRGGDDPTAAALQTLQHEIDEGLPICGASWIGSKTRQHWSKPWVGIRTFS
jgi:hypothetical protein